MKCLSCRQVGKHFQKKICPPCTTKGITRESVIIKRQSTIFIGKECREDASHFLTDLASKGKDISHVREKFISNKYDSSKDEVHLSWSEHEPITGGADDKRQTDKS